jgi:tRNA A37 threonylcarbamoyltransferase TsaD
MFSSIHSAVVCVIREHVNSTDFTLKSGNNSGNFTNERSDCLKNACTTWCSTHPTTQLSLAGGACKNSVLNFCILRDVF